MKSYHIALIVISTTFIIIGYYQPYYQHNIVDAVRDNSSNASMMMNENSNTMKGSNISTRQLSTSSSFSFNTDVPILIPLIDGYYNGTRVYFIHTETSEKSMSDMMTNMINFPTLYVPQLSSMIPEKNMSSPEPHSKDNTTESQPELILESEEPPPPAHDVVHCAALGCPGNPPNPHGPPTEEP
jgi:hypothetical protein